jgi:hypothetical protein
MPDGRPIDPHDDWEEWKALLAEASIMKDARLHDARHTCGTLLGEQHVDMRVIQAILGHAQVSTTRIYTDPTNALTREAADKIGRALWPDIGDLAADQRHIADELRKALEDNDAERIQRALQAARHWAERHAPDTPDGRELQLEMQLPPASGGSESGETPGRNGCAARDLNPEPAD